MSGAQLPCVLRATGSPVYVRFHGPSSEHLYSGSYSDEDLHWWAQRIREGQAQGREVLGYFNNDPHGWALNDAHRLRRMVEGHR